MDVVIGRELDLEDLYTTPNDGNRYEILNGALVMTPPPNLAHQRASHRLGVLLDKPARQAGFEVFQAPLAWRIAPGQVPEPDLIVAAAEVLTQQGVEGPPVLVIEIVSPSGRPRDLHEKRRIYAEGGAAWYWVVDPVAPSLLVLRLVGDGYEEAANVDGDEAYETHEPFGVRVVPNELIR